MLSGWKIEALLINTSSGPNKSVALEIKLLRASLFKRSAPITPCAAAVLDDFRGKVLCFVARRIEVDDGLITVSGQCLGHCCANAICSASDECNAFCHCLCLYAPFNHAVSDRKYEVQIDHVERGHD